MSFRMGTILAPIVIFCMISFSSGLPLLENPSEGGKIWALLVAGSNGYWNYRHQADICHAYQILHSYGIPDENIITMMYDDIATDSSNPMPGKIINKPGGKDVYSGVLKDYTGDDVNKDNFLNILQGNSSAMKNIGSGKVIVSGPNDHIFVNFVDHGSTGLLCFPNDYLYADELMSTLKKLTKDKKFKKLLLYIEACEAGSMFENLLPTNTKILASTASNADESSYGCYCDEPEFDTCLGDLYSVTWMEHLDALTPNKEQKETILSEYRYVKKHVNESHVTLYGDRNNLGSNRVKSFLGSKKKSTEMTAVTNPNLNVIASRDVVIESINKQIKRESSNIKKASLIQTLSHMKKMRGQVDQTISAIISETSHKININILNQRYPVTLDIMPCYKDLIQQFSENCYNPLKNPYVLRYFYVFINMCSMDSINKNEIKTIFKTKCTDKQRQALNIQ